MIYGSWDIRHDGQSFLSIYNFFCPLILLTIWKIKILNKQKRSGDNIILHLFTTNDIAWCMFPEIWSAIDNALSFWATFCPFTQLTTPKIKTWKKMKKARRYYHFTLVYHKWRSHVCYGYRMYGSWDMQHNR